MGKEPANLVLEQIKLLRADNKDLRGEMQEMRGDIAQIKTNMRQVKVTQDRHTLSLDYLEERVEMLREGTLKSISVATSTHAGNKKLALEMAELTKRVDKLEKAK